MKVYSRKYGEVKLYDSPMAKGGEGEVYLLLRALPALSASVCAKIYFEGNRNAERFQKTKYMANSVPSSLRGTGYTIAWPLDVLYNSSNQFVGFLMYRAPEGSEKLSVLATPNVAVRGSLNTIWHSYFDRKDDGVHIVNRLMIMQHICLAISQIHRMGLYVLKDFKPDNILTTYDGNVTIVDIDSIQICDRSGSLLYPAPVATKEYIPPEYHNSGVGKSRSEAIKTSWDVFAIGVVFYKMLMGLHPYVATPLKKNSEDYCDTLQDKINAGLFPFGPHRNELEGYPPPHDKFKYLPEQLQTLFRKTFAENPLNRPTIDEWTSVLKGILTDVNSKLNINNASFCHICGEKYSNQTDVYCTNCGTKKITLK